MISTSLYFDHRGRTASDKEGPIEVRINADGLIRYVPTGIKVIKKNFKQGVVVDRFDADELNERLAIIKKKIDAEVNRQMKTDSGIDVYKLKACTKTVAAQDDNSLLLWIEDQIYALDRADDTRKHYISMLTRLADFGKMRSWQDVTVENIYAFDHYLHEYRKPLRKLKSGHYEPGDHLCDGSIYNYHKNLKAMLNVAYKIGVMKQPSPYDRLKGVFKRGQRENIEYLTEDEMHMIEDMHPLKGSEIWTARDIFIIQMYTGLAYSDAQNLDLSKYQNIDGRWQYNGERLKTGVSFISQLLPPVVDALNRHGWQVPKMNLCNYNRALFTIGVCLGIDKKMHSHLARHTFATYMLRNGVKIENLSRMLGHTNITQTQRYAKVLAESVHEDFDMIAEKLTKNK